MATSITIGAGITIGDGITLSGGAAVGGASIVTDSLLFNLDIKNYTSGTTWPDSTGDHTPAKNFTLSASNLSTGAGTNAGYFTFSGTNYANGPSNVMAGNLAGYTKAIIFQPAASIPAPGHIFSSTLESAPIMTVVNGSVTAGNSNTAAITFTKSPAFNATTWYYLVVVFDSTLGSQNWKIYLNGNQTPVATANSITKSASATTVQLASQANSNGYSGKIAAAQMWTKALTSAEVAQMYTAYSGRYGF
jgi:hypothetical protein